MTPDILLALIVFAFASSITPGPNNMMLMASGANFGFRRTVPHMLGVSLGFTLMVLLVGIGLVQIFVSFPVSYTVLKVVSVVYLVYLAWKIATAAPTTTSKGEGGTPMTFMQAVLFQWVNPKGWTMALTAVSIYSPSQSLSAVASVAGVFGAVNFPCIFVWVVMGLQMQRLLTSASRLRAFNIFMAVLLVGSLYPVLMPA
ncbi:MAG: threonine/homoserine/homoserine lactone efflux protein [Halioglobus sp.]|jgi:threonine/homoserine/homoserine lactone efflux protein